MVDMQLSNTKLVKRGVNMIMAELDVDEAAQGFSKSLVLCATLSTAPNITLVMLKSERQEHILREVSITIKCCVPTSASSSVYPEDTIRRDLNELAEQDKGHQSAWRRPLQILPYLHLSSGRAYSLQEKDHHCRQSRYFITRRRAGFRPGGTTNQELVRILPPT